MKCKKEASWTLNEIIALCANRIILGFSFGAALVILLMLKFGGLQ